jgi:hypothetical protein
VPEGEPRPHGVIEREQVELAPEPPVIALRLKAMDVLLRHENPPCQGKEKGKRLWEGGHGSGVTTEDEPWPC